MDDQEVTHQIVYYRTDGDGARQRRVLTLDAKRNWLSDVPAPLVLPSAPTPARNAQEHLLNQHGVRFAQLSDKTLLLTHVPGQVVDFMAIFSREPVADQQLAALQERYFREKDTLAADPNCPSTDCAEAALVQKYVRLGKELSLV